MNNLQTADFAYVPQPGGGPTLAHKATAFTILSAASVAFVAMVLWPLVARFA